MCKARKKADVPADSKDKEEKEQEADPLSLLSDEDALEMDKQHVLADAKYWEAFKVKDDFYEALIAIGQVRPCIGTNFNYWPLGTQ